MYRMWSCVIPRAGCEERGVLVYVLALAMDAMDPELGFPTLKWS